MDISDISDPSDISEDEMVDLVDLVQARIWATVRATEVAVAKMLKMNDM